MKKTLLSKTTEIKEKAIVPQSLLDNPEYDTVEPPNIVSNVNNGKILSVNTAACRLLGYSAKELIKKKIATIVDINDSRYKKMLEQRIAAGHSRALITMIRKNGRRIACLISSTLFTDMDGTEQAITMIADMTQVILMQKNIAVENERVRTKNMSTAGGRQKNKETIDEVIVAENIASAISTQIKLDIQKEKTVADNVARAMLKQMPTGSQKDKVAQIISTALAQQKLIDAANEKLVAENIALVISKQIKLDKAKEKIVAQNIAIAIAKQKQLDIKNDKIVAKNIALALAKQKVIDATNKKIVADNIAIALAKQIAIDNINEKIVAGDIATAISKQIKLDVAKRKIVAENIALAISKRKQLDLQNDIAVAKDIALALAKQKVIDIKNKKTVADNIALALAKQKRIDTEREKIVAENIAVALLKQKGVDIKKEKIVADNILKALAKSEARTAENNKWIKHIAKTSYDVMWDWDVITNKIYVGESVAEVFGYILKNSTVTFADFTSCLLPEEKDRVIEKLRKTLKLNRKAWRDTFKLKRYDGTIAFTASRAIIIRNEKSGRAVRLIGALKDVSRLQGLEEKLQEQIPILQKHSEKFLLAAKLSFDVIWDWNLLTDEIFISDQFKELFGYTIKDNKGTIEEWFTHLHPRDKEAVQKGIYGSIASASAYWEHTFRYVRADGSIALVMNRASIIRDKNGKALRMIGAIQDISRQGVQKKPQQRIDSKMFSF